MEILATIPAEQPKKYLVTFSLSGGAVVEIEAFSDAEAMKKAENLPISEILIEHVWTESFYTRKSV